MNVQKNSKFGLFIDQFRMNTLYEFSDRQIDTINTDFIRSFIKILDMKHKLTGIVGSRGVGKTTLILQFLKINRLKEKAVYISMDDLYFSENRLIDFVDDFIKYGGKYLFIDEIHFYKNWSQELKLIYDRYPGLRTVFTGSSMLEIEKGRADLSRRALIYKMQGLSFREFINVTEKTDFRIYTLEDILSQHRNIGTFIRDRILPLKKFSEYIKYGYYPYFLEDIETYFIKLRNVLNLILDVDLPNITEITHSSIEKIKQLLFIIASSVPFKPNLSKLSERLGINRNTLKIFFYYLERADIIIQLFSSVKGASLLNKPEKIYLHHPNLSYVFRGDKADTGSIRETFFINQLLFNHTVNYTKYGDFYVDGTYTFEVGGKGKTHKQIKGLKDAYLVKDNIETGLRNEIPLWLFGFLY